MSNFPLIETFRQDLLNELKSREQYYKSLPNGIYTGFKIIDESCRAEGIIALLKSKFANEKQDPYELIYIDKTGESVLKNRKEILDALSKHSNMMRFVPAPVDDGEQKEIELLQNALRKGLENLKQTEINASTNSRDLPDPNKKTVNIKFSNENMDLVTWFIVSK